MGKDIQGLKFGPEDEREFEKRLRQETKILMNWFKEGVFEKAKTPLCGLEVEYWLADENFLPMPEANKFLEMVNHPLIVPEIANFNFEINVDPRPLTGRVLSDFHQDLTKLTNLCREKAKLMNAHPIMIGSLPTLKEEMLSLDHIYPSKRYYALNDQILQYRKNRNFTLKIDGKEQYEHEFSNLMLESAATSLQIHLQVTQENGARFYNAGLLLAPFMAALCANSPFLFGKALWNENRVPIFEQAVDLEYYPRLHGRKARRVSLGNGYVKESLFELFLDNLDGYPVLLPDVMNEDPNWLAHLRLHNGTIWRWNRPIVGIDKHGKPHLRIEHRVPSTGPSIKDNIANMAFFLGAVHYLANQDEPPEANVPFEELRRSFYSACELGLNADIYWKGKKKNLQKVLFDELLPAASVELYKLDVNQDDIEDYFHDLLEPRVLAGQTAANWQRAYVNTHGKRFQDMMEVYYDYQKRDIPIHEWKA